MVDDPGDGTTSNSKHRSESRVAETKTSADVGGGLQL